jgi:glutamate racemase
MSTQNTLGVFDSGVGGFSVLKEIRKSSNADIVYYGDCARAPYGNKSEEEIISCIRDGFIFLEEKKVTHFVNACNSMSTVTTDKLLQDCGIKASCYTDMIRAFDAHATFTTNDRVLVFATTATIRSGIYQHGIEAKGAEAFSCVFKDLAFAIENNSTREELLEIIKKGMMYAKEIEATHIVYGCTHYPLIHGLFLIVKEEVRWSGEFINPALYVEKEVRKWNLQGNRKFYPYTSKDTAVFIKNIVQLL